MPERQSNKYQTNKHGPPRRDAKQASMKHLIVDPTQDDT